MLLLYSIYSNIGSSDTIIRMDKTYFTNSKSLRKQLQTLMIHFGLNERQSSSDKSHRSQETRGQTLEHWQTVICMHNIMMQYQNILNTGKWSKASTLNFLVFRGSQGADVSLLCYLRDTHESCHRADPVWVIMKYYCLHVSGRLTHIHFYVCVNII